MRLQEKLKKETKQQIWDEYCGFLDMSLKDYMYVQNRLMVEQLGLWLKSGIGKSFLTNIRHDRPTVPDPETVEDFRRLIPLTTYKDYADILLKKRAEMLPDNPVVWIQTTWEGGLRPIKLAPYTRSMLDAYKHNAMTIMMLATSNARGNFNVHAGDKVLYGGAPLPYATGLLPSLMDEDITMQWLPDKNTNSELSFSGRIKKGFEYAYKHGLDYMFGIGSVANYITESFGRKSSSHVSASLWTAWRYLRASYICRRDNRPMVPGDIFKIKGFISTGTDSKCYKEKLGKAWGRMPIEIAAGTETTCIGTETWEQNGMVLFPDACFYEFIPEDEMRKNLADPEYKPKTCLMDEVSKDCDYELVVSVLKGGVFMRYRVGDVYRCLSAGGGKVPRFTFVDRIPTVIDIAGFTRITENSINEVISLSKLGIASWLARKEYTEDNCPYLHLFIEVSPHAAEFDSVKKSVLSEHLSIYFKSFDSDYGDLKKLLNIDPLRITILKYGTIAGYEARTGQKLPRINPPGIDITELMKQKKNIDGEDRQI